MPNVTLFNNLSTKAWGPSFMYPVINPINGTVTITVTGNVYNPGINLSPSSTDLGIALFGPADWQLNPVALQVAWPGTYTFTANNALGIRAISLRDPWTPITVTASW